MRVCAATERNAQVLTPSHALRNASTLARPGWYGPPLTTSVNGVGVAPHELTRS